MGNLLAYSGVVTKVRGLKSKLLHPDEFEEIAELKSIADVVTYLKTKPGYEKEFEALDETRLHRGDVEKMLLKSLYNDYSGLYAFSGIAQKKFLKLYLKRYEVRLINYCLRIVFNQYPQPFDLLSKKVFFEKYSKIPMDKVIAATNVSELIDALKGTDYYEPMNRLRENHVNSLYEFDRTLNLYFYTYIWREKRKILKGKELKGFTNNLGIEIDLLNLEWMYRAKKYYEMAPADIYRILIPIHYKIHNETFKNLVEAPTLEEFIKIFKETIYGRQLEGKETYTMEQLSEAYMMDVYKKERRDNPYSIATLNTYLHLKELEIEKLTGALECIRYGMTPQEILVQIRGAVK